MSSSVNLWLSVVGVGLLVIAVTAAAQEEPQRIIQDRIANFREIGTAFKNIRDELRLKQPDVVEIQTSTRLIRERSAHILEWFPPGSEPPPPKTWLERISEWFSKDTFALATDEETHAKPEIWTQRADFEKNYREFEAEITQMERVAQGGVISAIALQFNKVGEACKACHDVYREEVD